MDRRVSRGARASISLALVCALAAVGCSGSSHPQRDSAGGALATAFRISDPADLIGGPAALAGIGDWMLRNDRIRVIVEDAGPSIGFVGAFGGGILDADLVRAADEPGNDRITQTFPVFLPRGAEADRIEVIADGSDGGAAVLRVTGHDGPFSFLQSFGDISIPDTPLDLGFTTDYTLAPGDAHVTMKTTLTNHGGRRRDVIVGDVLLFGSDLQVYGPGYPLDDFPTLSTVDHLVGIGDGTSYGYGTRGGKLVLPLVDASQTGALTNGLKGLGIDAGGSASYERWFAVGSGDTASASAQILKLRGTATGQLEGHVTSADGSAAPAGSWVDLYASDSSYEGRIAVAADGSFAADLLPASYSVIARAYGRHPSTFETVDVSAGASASKELSLGTTGTVHYEISSGGAPSPGKIIFEAYGDSGTLDSDLDPELGPRNTADASANYVYSASGSGDVAVPPGTYRVTVTRGPEFTLSVTDRMEVVADGTVPLSASLDRVVDTSGWLAADFHQHCTNSDDSPVGRRDRVVSNVAMGIEYVANTDHDFVSNLDPLAHDLGVDSIFHAMPGNEISTLNMGHFNAFPLTPDPSIPDGGALDWQNLTSGQIYEAAKRDPAHPITMLNHGRSGLLGHLDFIGYDRTTGESEKPFYTNFEALEVNLTPDLLLDWYSLLDQGYTFTAVGNSDTHRLKDSEVGQIRNYVHVGSDDPRAVSPKVVVDTLRAPQHLDHRTLPYLRREPHRADRRPRDRHRRRSRRPRARAGRALDEPRLRGDRGQQPHARAHRRAAVDVDGPPRHHGVGASHRRHLAGRDRGRSRGGVPSAARNPSRLHQPHLGRRERQRQVRPSGALNSASSPFERCGREGPLSPAKDRSHSLEVWRAAVPRSRSARSRQPRDLLRLSRRVCPAGTAAHPAARTSGTALPAPRRRGSPAATRRGAAHRGRNARACTEN